MILLTGSSGFIGSHLLSFIKKSDNLDVVVLTSKPIEDAQYVLHNNYFFEPDLLINAGYGEDIHVIIHVGAFTPKNAQEANLIKECNSNITSVETLLKLDLPNLKKIIFLSTLDVYGDEHIIDESSIINPATLYGLSKLYGEKMISIFAKNRGLVSQILRIGHVYGPGEEKYQKIIPLTIRKLIDNQEIEIWGEGKELRAFIFIDDVVKAIMNVLSIENDLGPINIVSDESISINDLIRRLIDINGNPHTVRHIAKGLSGKSWRFNNDKMKKYLLSKQVTLTEGLTIEWDYMKNLI
jgi:UDP-glucose 4-epimerase